jgi:hypothetical protein
MLNAAVRHVIKDVDKTHTKKHSHSLFKTARKMTKKAEQTNRDQCGVI